MDVNVQMPNCAMPEHNNAQPPESQRLALIHPSI